MTNEEIKRAFNACDNWLAATGGERFKEALAYMKEAAYEKLAKEEFKQGETVEWISGDIRYGVIVTNGQPLSDGHFCGTVINGNHDECTPGLHGNNWIKPEFRRL